MKEIDIFKEIADILFYRQLFFEGALLALFGGNADS